MLKIFKIILPVTVLALVMSLMIGCSSAGTGINTGTNQTPSSSSTQNQGSLSGQQSSGTNTTHNPGTWNGHGGNGGTQMNQMLSKVAQILNVPED